MSEYREYIDHTAAIRRKRFDLTGWGRENAFIADGNRIKDDTSYTHTSEGLLDNPPTKLAKKPGHVFAKTSAGLNHRESVTGELTGIRTSEAERVLVRIEGPLVLTEIADVTGNNSESRGEAGADTGAIIVPSIVTEAPRVEPAKGSTVSKPQIPKKAVVQPKAAVVIQQEQVEEREVAVPRVIEEQLETEKDRLEQESSLELAMQLAEEEAERLKLEARTKSSKKEESDYWGKSSGSESYITESPKSAIELQLEEEAKLKLEEAERER